MDKDIENTSSKMISLNGNKWMIWKLCMEDLLCCKDLHEPLEGKKDRPKETSEGLKKVRL